ncbi:uncharacterized protein LOC109835947 [Asparagus officinalis]|uniref:uncharacterized protein LOC109835947 n=1 Tax=Asparagus officinalis TaxID=4686 RepID=UPI00098DE6F4|nr:uncharacterized protein LOC109835947 [Asparagus officinalis]
MHPKTWYESLPYLQFVFNRAIHGSSGKSPFEFLPPSLFDLMFSSEATVDGKEESERQQAQRFLEKIAHIHATVEAQLKKSQAKYKAKHNQHQVPCNFGKCDMVWLKLSKERLKGEGKKLKPIRYGPFRIIDQIGDNAFKLDLPPYLGMYSVINIEYLKLFEPPLLDDEAAYHDYEIWKMDVRIRYLSGYLEEDIYMEQLERFIPKGEENKVWKLNRLIYGLKKASRSWNLRFDEAIKSFGFIQNIDEAYLYKKVSGSTITFLVLYVDDILLIGSDVAILSRVKIWLSNYFSMKDLKNASYILGLK